MTEATTNDIHGLDGLNLPALQARYAEVVGETTRCPNRVFLVRRITERLAQVAETPPAPGGEETTAATAEPTPEASLPAESAPVPADAGAEGLPEDAAGDPAGNATGAGDGGETPLTKLTVDELRALYVEVIGRETGSVDRGYLMWKIREARKGRIRVGAIQRGATAPGARGEHMVLPLRMPADVVAALDDAWKQLGLRSRMDLFRRSLRHYLAAQEQPAAVELLDGLLGTGAKETT